MLWEPSAEAIERSRMTAYTRWLAEHRGVEAPTTRRSGAGRSRTSTTSGRRSGSTSRSRPTATHPPPWPRARCPAPPGSRARSSTTRSTSSAGVDDDEVAVLHASELRELGELRWGELREQVAAVAEGLRARGRNGGRPGRRLSAQRRRGPGRVPRDAPASARSGRAAPRLRPIERRRSLRPDRAQGDVRRGRLPLRRQGLRPHGDRRRHRRPDPEPRAGRRRPATSRSPQTSRPSKPVARRR